MYYTDILSTGTGYRLNNCIMKYDGIYILFVRPCYANRQSLEYDKAYIIDVDNYYEERCSGSNYFDFYNFPIYELGVDSHESRLFKNDNSYNSLIYCDSTEISLKNIYKNPDFGYYNYYHNNDFNNQAFCDLYLYEIVQVYDRDDVIVHRLEFDSSMLYSSASFIVSKQSINNINSACTFCKDKNNIFIPNTMFYSYDYDKPLYYLLIDSFPYTLEIPKNKCISIEGLKFFYNLINNIVITKQNSWEY